MKKHYVIVLKSGHELHVTVDQSPIINFIKEKDNISKTLFMLSNAHGELVLVVRISEVAAIYLATAKEMEGT